MNRVVPLLRRSLLDQRLERLGERLANVWKTAELVHPDRPLSRGFARVTDRSGHTLIHAAQAEAAHALTLRFGDGTVDVVTSDPQPAAPPPPRKVERKARSTYVAPQPGLFDGDS